jgi:hypothetical protein
LEQIAREAAAAYYDAGLKAHVEAARDEWPESVNAEVEAQVDSDRLDTLKANAQAVIPGSRRSTPRSPRRAIKSRSTRRSRTTRGAEGSLARLYVFEGVVLIVLGVLAIAYPVFATLAVDLGCLFLLSGVLALV